LRIYYSLADQLFSGKKQTREKNGRMKKLAGILLLLMATTFVRANPVVRGTWFGYILNKETKLPTTLYITDDNDQGNVAGEITISFQYISGKTYSCQARFTGYIDQKTFEFSLVMEEYVYYDLLPEGMKWCLGTIYGSIGREMELRKYFIQGTMRTKCTEDVSDVVLIKQE
jgi:hypothetical protein